MAEGRREPPAVGSGTNCRDDGGWTPSKRIFFTVLGLTLLTLSGATGLGKWRFQERATHAEGLVTRLNGGGSHPQIGFTTASGARITYAQGGLVFGYRSGDHVEVLYNPDDPQATATVNRFGAVWAMPLMLGLLGIGFLGSACIDVATTRRG